MSQPHRRPIDPMAAVADQIRRLESRIRELEARPFRIPILGADPPTTDPANLWLFPDGRLRGRHLNPAGSAYVTREWVTTAPGSSTSATAVGTPATAPNSHTVEYPATWSQSYQELGTARTDDGTILLYYGKATGDTVNGRNRSLVGFDYTTIAAALSGSTIESVKLRLQNLGSGVPSGSDIHFGIHNFTSEPATWAGGGIPSSMLAKRNFGPTEMKVVNLPLDFAQAIRDGWGKGIALEAPSDSLEFYGVAAGFGSGYTLPTLIISYAK